MPQFSWIIGSNPALSLSLSLSESNTCENYSEQHWHFFEKQSCAESEMEYLLCPPGELFSMKQAPLHGADLVWMLQASDVSAFSAVARQ